MSNLGVTKGTQFEEQIEVLAKGEEGGASMYAALSFLAKEKGLDEVSEELMKIAIDELRHAGLYSVLNGHVSDDIFSILEKFAPIETGGLEKLQQFAQSVKSSGLESATKHIEEVAADEGRHGKTLEKLIEDNLDKA